MSLYKLSDDHDNQLVLKIIGMGKFGIKAIEAIISTQHFTNDPRVAFICYEEESNNPEYLRQLSVSADMVIYLTENIDQLKSIYHYKPSHHCVAITTQSYNELKQDHVTLFPFIDAVITNNKIQNFPPDPQLSHNNFTYFYWALRTIIDPILGISIIGFDYADMKEILNGFVMFAVGFNSHTEITASAYKNAIMELKKNGVELNTVDISHALTNIAVEHIDLDELDTIENISHSIFSKNTVLKTALTTNDTANSLLVTLMVVFSMDKT